MMGMESSAGQGLGSSFVCRREHEDGGGHSRQVVVSSTPVLLEKIFFLCVSFDC